MAGRLAACLLVFAFALTVCGPPIGTGQQPDRNGSIVKREGGTDTAPAAKAEPAGAASGAPERGDTPGLASVLTIVEGSENPPVPFVAGRSVFGLGPGEVQTAEEPLGPLMGHLSPVAALSPDGHTLVYSAWRELVEVDPLVPLPHDTPVAVPVIRAVDIGTGTDSLLAEGGFSAAWRDDGALAYFKGLELAYTPGRLYTGHVMVRTALDTLAEPWTTEAARYSVVAWAGPHLVVYRQHCCELLDLLVLDGPGAARVLGAPVGVVESTRLIGLSPDGSLALIVEGVAPQQVRLMDVATGIELARLEPGQIASAGIDILFDHGSWVGDRVVTGGMSAEGTSGLVLLRIGPGEVSVERILSFDPGRFPWGAYEPQFADNQGNRAVAWAHVPPGEAAHGGLIIPLDCDLVRGQCIASPARHERNVRPVSGGVGP